MSISNYFLKQSDYMPQRKVVVSDTTEGPNLQSREANEETSMGADAELDIRSEPAVHKVIREVTVNLTRVIEDKLGPVPLLLQVQGKQLEDHETRIKEAVFIHWNVRNPPSRDRHWHFDPSILYDLGFTGYLTEELVSQSNDG